MDILHYFMPLFLDQASIEFIHEEINWAVHLTGRPD